MKQKQIVLCGFLGLTALGMIGGAIAMLFPRWQSSDEMLVSITLIGFYALGVMALVMYGKRLPKTRALSVIGLLISLVFFLVDVWFNGQMSWKWGSIITSIGGITLSLACGLMYRVFVWPIKPRGLGGLVIKWAAIVFALVTVWIIVYGFATEGTSYWGRGYLRIMWISVILTAGTTIATAALAIFGLKPGEDEPGLLAPSIPVSITCPRCQSAVEAQSNRESRCSECRLKIRIEVEEPRCLCGYSLYQLESDTCPECGRVVGDEDRWASCV